MKTRCRTVWIARGTVALGALISGQSLVPAGAAASPSLTRIADAHPEQRGEPSLSRDGRFVVFTSDATAPSQVWLYDRKTNTRQLVSATRAGKGGNGPSDGAMVSDDGRLVIFESQASDLVPDDTNHRQDIFLRDVAHHRTIAVSTARDGRVPASDPAAAQVGISSRPVLSGNGRVAAFVSCTDLVGDEPGAATPCALYRRGLSWRGSRLVVRPVELITADPHTGLPATALAGYSSYPVPSGSETGEPGQGARPFDMPSMDAIGRRLAFVSYKPLLAADKDATDDVYVYDAARRSLTLLSGSVLDRVLAEQSDNYATACQQAESQAGSVVFKRCSTQFAAPTLSRDGTRIIVYGEGTSTTSAIFPARGWFAGDFLGGRWTPLAGSRPVQAQPAFVGDARLLMEVTPATSDERWAHEVHSISSYSLASGAVTDLTPTSTGASCDPPFTPPTLAPDPDPTRAFQDAADVVSDVLSSVSATFQATFACQRDDVGSPGVSADGRTWAVATNIAADSGDPNDGSWDLYVVHTS